MMILTIWYRFTQLWTISQSVTIAMDNRFNRWTSPIHFDDSDDFPLRTTETRRRAADDGGLAELAKAGKAILWLMMLMFLCVFIMISRDFMAFFDYFTEVEWIWNSMTDFLCCWSQRILSWWPVSMAISSTWNQGRWKPGFHGITWSPMGAYTNQKRSHYEDRKVHLGRTHDMYMYIYIITHCIHSHDIYIYWVNIYI